MFVVLCCCSLLILVHSLTAHSLVEVYLMTIELRAINASKEGLATYRYSASATHTCAIDHQGVERYGAARWNLHQVLISRYYSGIATD